MKTLNKKIIFLIGFLFVTLIPFFNIANAACPPYPDEQIDPTISITGVSVTNGIVSISVSFTAGTRIWYDEHGNITTICHGEIGGINLYIYRSDGSKFAETHAYSDYGYSGLDTLQWTSPSFTQNTYTLKAYALDYGLPTRLHGFTRSAPATATVFIDNPLPRITSPADGSTVCGVGMYNVVDVTGEFFSPRGLKEIGFEVWDGHYPLPKKVSGLGYTYSQPYPTSVTYTFQWQAGFREGAYNFIAKATDSYGAWARSDPVTVTLVKGPPTASFTYSPENPLIYDEVTFDASSSYDDGWIVKYEWDFGDGDSAEVRVVRHIYDKPGEYTVTLTVEDNDGMTDSVRTLVSVREAEQMVEPVKGCVYSGFGDERMRNGKMEPHWGIDIVWPKPGDIKNAIVIAPASGVVDGVGDDPNVGYWIRLKHRRVRRRDGTVVENVYTFYCHLQALPPFAKNDDVTQGQFIGNVGDTGVPGNYHLHFGVREGENPDDFVDPTKYVEYPGCKELRVEAHSPIDIRLVDPDGYIVSKTLIEIEMTATYLEDDFDGDGKTDDRIWLTDRKAGDYWITILPEPNAQPTDTYSLGVRIDGQTMVLAVDVQIQDIPTHPYEVESKLCYSDFDGDNHVDFADYAIFAYHWQDVNCPGLKKWCNGADLDFSSNVDFNDLFIFANNWLYDANDPNTW